MTRTPGDTDYLAVVVVALAAEVDLDPSQIDAGQELATIAGIESVKILRAVVRVEDECHIAVPDDFLFETATVRDLADLVSRLAGQAR
jgi:acyl carrier protein